MSFFKIHSDNFYSSFFEKDKLSHVFNAVHFGENLIGNNPVVPEGKGVFSISLVPNYLKLQAHPEFKQTKVFQKTGFAIDISQVKSVEQYQKSFCKRNFRDNTKRRLSRLESCFNIQYKTYHGSITKEEHTMLMECMRSMLKERFIQRKDNNPILSNWSYYLENSYQAINGELASLFVIFNEETPIALSLNYMHHPVYYFGVPTFDLYYSKFSLGNILIYKQLEWCFDNRFAYFDMGYGDLEYKRQWCNASYSFEHHILHEGQEFIASVCTKYLKNKYKIINYLMDKNINKQVNRFKRFLKGKNESINLEEYTLEPIENDSLKMPLDPIDNDTTMKLKGAIIDFLYSNKESMDDMTVHCIANQPDSYLLRGKNVQMIAKITSNQ